MSFHGGHRLSMASFTVHIHSYSFIFVHIRQFTIPFTPIYVHLRPLTSIDVDHLRPWAWEAWLFPKYKNCFFRKYKDPIISNPYEINLLQRKIENGGYLEKSRFYRWKQGKSTSSPKTWNHPMVIEVILGGTVCSKHTLKVCIFQKTFSVNVRVFCECKSNLPDRPPSIGMSPQS